MIATLDTKQHYALNTLVVINLKPAVEFNIRYLLALFNSKLVNWYYVTFFKSTKKVFSEIQARQVKQIPIPLIDINNNQDSKVHDKIVHLVNQILEAKKKLATAKMDRDINYYERRCTSIDREINIEVYNLYGLSQPEINIIKGISEE